MTGSTIGCHARVPRTVLVAAALALVVGVSSAGAEGPEGRSHRYTVVLESLSVGERLARARSTDSQATSRRLAAASHALMARAVERSQEPIIRQIEASGATVLGAVRSVLNAVFVRATPDQADAMRRIAGVRSVVRARELKQFLDAVAHEDIVRLGAARRLRSDSAVDGEGLRIAIIDSGLDFDHEAFQDESLDAIAGYPKGRPEHLEFASRKVIAVRSYMHLQNSARPETSTPDDDSPRDFSGHGTAVAMIAAGRRVALPGNRVAEGVAPRAYLGVYKVSGTPAIHDGPSSQAVISAIDDAVTDGMDILNISLGVPAEFPWQSAGRDCGGSGPSMTCDPLAVAAQSAAVDFGRVVVAAAGNAGALGVKSIPTAGTIASPAIAPDVIAVGATVNARRQVQSVHADNARYAALSGSGPAVDARITGPAELSAKIGNRYGCDPYEDSSLDGKIAITERGECRFVDKVENAYQAGAIAVLIYDPDGNDTLLEMSSLEDTEMPAYFMGASDGRALSASVSASRGLQLTFDASPSTVIQDWHRVADFSARGPTPGLNLKPDIAAPGDFVLTAAARQPWRQGTFRPTGFHQLSGTSLSAPFVAGAAALVWQRHPDYTAREVASSLINSANRTVMESGEPARAGAVGGGLLDIERALDPIATVEPPTVGFGNLQGRRLPTFQTIVVTNRGSSPEAYSMTVIARDTDARASVRINGAQRVSFGLQPNEFLRLQVSLEGLLPEPGSYEGHLLLTRTDRTGALRVPFLYVIGAPVPHDGFAVFGGDEYGIAGERSLRDLVAKFVDRSGAPVANAPVAFVARTGDVRVLSASTVTDRFGLAGARVEYSGSIPPAQVIASAGGVEIPFWYEAYGTKPTIATAMSLALYESGTPVAPGSVIAVEGSGLAEFTGSASGSPLPIALKSASASFDFPELGLSVPARVHFASPGQLNLQVPWELAGVNFAFLKVRLRSKVGAWFVSEPVLVDMVEAAPGILSYSLESGELLPELSHADGRPLHANDPARPGDVVVAAMTGNGPLASPIPTGYGTEDYIEAAHPHSVTVGGLQAIVEYAGSLPGAAGLYQVDFVVPSNLSSGNWDLQVTVHGSPSNVVQLPVRNEPAS